MEKHADLILVCLCLLYILNISNGNSPEVTLSTGRVRGHKLVSVVNKLYYSFQGIPYAQPPVGNLRFKAPQPLKKWDGVLNAYDIPPACSQPWRQVKFPERYSEDCLYLNVFTPYLKPPGDVLMPVMVWIHGGQHYQGSSTKYKYGPDFLITEDVILVTFSYRLGVFGYLNLNTKSAQGNAALKDMVAVLRWVQKEISQFGGDPERVTIFGGSSGGQHVNCLYLSPMAQGLFHGAISQSSPHCGTLANSFSVNPNTRLVDMMGCASPDPEAAVACLRGIEVQKLAQAQLDVIPLGPGELANPFSLSVEKDYGEEMFLPISADKLLESSNNNIPYILGMNSEEGTMHLKDPIESPFQFSEFEKDFELYIPSDIRKQASKKIINVIVKMLKKFYFDDKPASVETIHGFINFMMDRQLTYNIIKTAQKLSNNASVFLYFFAFEGKFQENIAAAKAFNISGVGHGNELGYLFCRNTLIVEQNFLGDYPRECTTLIRMVRMWTNFAKYGNPTPNKTDELLGVTWLPVNKAVARYLLINDSLVFMNEPLLPDRVAIWDNIYSLIFENSIYGSSESASSYAMGINIIIALLILALISGIFLIYDCWYCNNDYLQLL